MIHFRTKDQGQITWRNNRITGMEIQQKWALDNEVPLSDDAFVLLKENPAKLRDASLKRLKPLDRSDVGAV